MKIIALITFHVAAISRNLTKGEACDLDEPVALDLCAAGYCKPADDADLPKVDALKAKRAKPQTEPTPTPTPEPAAKPAAKKSAKKKTAR